MKVTPDHISEYYNGNEIGRYGRDLHSEQMSQVFVWYHDGFRNADEPAWAMDEDVEFKIGISVKTILVAHPKSKTLYAVDRKEMCERKVTIDEREQFYITASDDFVTEIGDPNDVLNGHLWVESGNQIDEGYHKAQNEA